MRRVVILGRGGAGKSTLARELSRRTGLPVIELDALFWRPGPTPTPPGPWTVRQRALLAPPAWIIDGDLGPYDRDLELRLRAADTVIVLDFGLLRCAARTLRRGREQAEYWRWLWAYRRRSLPVISGAIDAAAGQPAVHVLRTPAAVRRFLATVSSGRS
ncbi:MAG: adenylate kinase [Actinobacteria bacterium]|nr:adenylate kinase [Actinomycetota bacterium]